MCGIIGVLSEHEAAPLLVEALKRLEYRGYDSAGIATVNHGTLARRRAVGKLAHLSDLLVHQPLAGKLGIGHTRWATHGIANETNAHPHQSGPVAVVHNGIIENFAELSAELNAAGYVRESQTDTETIALLAHHALQNGATPVEAARQTLARLEGAFALCFLFQSEDNLLICARKGSPLAIGHGEGEMFVGSDAIALAPMTDRITYLEEGDWAVLTRSGATIFDVHNQQTTRDITRVHLDSIRIEKAGHKHFMAKEIAEQPAVVADTLHSYTEGQDIIMPEGLNFDGIDRVILIACGTAHYACHVAKYWFETIAGLPAEIDIASEFRYRDPVLSPRAMVILVSQSGETADTLAALRHVKGKVASIVAVVNVPTSSIAREADIALPIHAGIEIGVASTKAFTCQLMTLLLMTLHAAVQRGRAVRPELIEALRTLPGFMSQTLELSNAIAQLSSELAEAQDVLFLGRGLMYPMALEGALKLKEISYIHAEGHAAGELKHGSIALIDPNVPVIVLAPHNAMFEKTMSNMQEVMARHAKAVLISDARGVAEGKSGVWKTLTLPEILPELAPILYAIPLQLLSYHTAVAKGTDVDQPRNLAKSVTVE